MAVAEGTEKSPPDEESVENLPNEDERDPASLKAEAADIAMDHQQRAMDRARNAALEKAAVAVKDEPAEKKKIRKKKRKKKKKPVAGKGYDEDQRACEEDRKEKREKTWLKHCPARW